MTLLRQPDLSLSEIALASGFADQSHFSRVFARQTDQGQITAELPDRDRAAIMVGQLLPARQARQHEPGDQGMNASIPSCLLFEFGTRGRFL